MTLKKIRNGLSLAFILAAMAGCSSTGTSEDANANANANSDAELNSGVSTGAADDAGLSSGDNSDMYAELGTVFYFDFDRSVLRPDARADLTGHAARLKSSGESVRLEGHADESGTREYNMALAERRANAVRDFLLLQGVGGSQMEAISYGEERPVVDGSSENARSQNRRVEMK